MLCLKILRIAACFNPHTSRNAVSVTCASLARKLHFFFTSLMHDAASASLATLRNDLMKKKDERCFGMGSTGHGDIATEQRTVLLCLCMR